MIFTRLGLKLKENTLFFCPSLSPCSCPCLCPCDCQEAGFPIHNEVHRAGFQVINVCMFDLVTLQPNNLPTIYAH